MKENAINWWKVALIILAVCALFAGGFFLGRKTMEETEPETKIEYVKGDTVRDTITKPVPILVKVIPDTCGIIEYCVKNDLYTELFPEKVRDSVIYVTDTAEVIDKIVEDWKKERLYSETLFESDTLGKCVVDVEVQHNQMKNLTYEFTPVTKKIEVIREKKNFISPFIGAGVTSMPTVVGQGGVFFEERYGISVLYQYQWETRQNIWGGTFIYKF